MKVGRSALGGAAAQVPHRLHRRRRCGDAGGAGRIRRGPGAHDGGDAGHRLCGDAAHLPGAEHARRADRLGRRRGADLGCGRGRRLPDAAEMPQDAQARLRALVPFCAPRNPVDCTAQVGERHEAGRHLRRERWWPTAAIPPSCASGRRPRPAAATAPSCARSWGRCARRIRTGCGCMSMLAPNKVRDYEADGWLVFEDPTRAVIAIEAMGRYGAAFAKAEDAARRGAAAAGDPAGDDADRGGGEVAARRGRHAGGAGTRGLRRGGGGRRGRGDRLPGGAEDPVARHPAQERDRRRAAGCRRCGRGARRASPRCWTAPGSMRPARGSRACWSPSRSRARWRWRSASSATRSSGRWRWSASAASSSRC